MKPLDVRLDSSDAVASLFEILSLPHDWGTGRWSPEPEMQVDSLAVTGSAASGALVRLAQRLRGVRFLKISDTHIGGDVGDWSSQLTFLHLHDLTEDSDVSGFANCSSLQHFSFLNACSERRVDLTSLADQPGLQSVTLGPPYALPTDVESVSQLGSLRSLTLLGVSDEALSPLLSPDVLPELETLRISERDDRSAMVESLSQVHPEWSIRVMRRRFR